MQAKRKFLPILLVIIVTVLVVAACSGGGGGQGKTMFNLPSTPVNVDANGAASIYGIGLGQLLTPDQVQQLQALGQKVELRVGHNGIHVYVNGEDQAYLAWDDESAGNLQELLAGVPGAETAAQALPWLRRVGLGASINVPAASGAALDIPRWRGETAISPQQPETTKDPLALGVSFDESGSGSLGAIPGSVIASLTGGANPLQLDPATLAQLKGLGINALAVQTTPAGIELTVNGKKMPGIAYDSAYLARTLNLLPAVAGGAVPDDLLQMAAEQLPGLNVALNVDLTGQPTDFKLSELPVKIGDSGNLEVMGIAIPGVSLPADTLQQLRDLGVSQLAVNASTEALNLAVDGKALPSIRFAPGGLATIAGIAGAQSGISGDAINALLDTVLKDGLSTVVAVGDAATTEAAPVEASYAPAELGDMAAPVIKLNATLKDGQITSVGGLSAEQLAGLGVALPALPANVMQILGDLDAKTVGIVNTPNNLEISVNGAPVASIDYDAASLATALELAKPYLAGTPLEDPAVMQLIKDQILPIAPAADLNVQIAVE